MHEAYAERYASINQSIIIGVMVTYKHTFIDGKKA